MDTYRAQLLTQLPGPIVERVLQDHGSVPVVATAAAEPVLAACVVTDLVAAERAPAASGAFIEMAQAPDKRQTL